MSSFLGVVRYEYAMAARRWGVWLAFFLSAIPYLISVRGFGTEPMGAPGGAIAVPTGLQLAGLAALMLNLLAPVVGGIVMADRLARDNYLGVSELLRSTTLSRRSYILGKYFGVVLATLSPVLVILLAGSGIMLANGVPVDVLAASLPAFLGINVPAYLFIGAYALACPMIMPVRVFQVLYTGYWFWGNFLSPKVMPTLAGTILKPSGQYVGGAFFGLAQVSSIADAHTQLEAILNLAVLGACILIALVSLDRYLAWQERRA